MTSDHHPTSRPPDDQAGHPDLDALADLDAGLLDPATTAELTRHVGGCPACGATLRALAAVRTELRSLPPPRLPESVAARLDATLAELRRGGHAHQARARAGAHPAPSAVASAQIDETRHGPAPPHGPRPGSLRPDPPRPDDAGSDDLARERERRRDRSRRLTTLAAASVVVLAAVVGVGTAVVRQDHDSKLTQSAAVPPEVTSRSESGGSASQQKAPADARPNEGPALVDLPVYTRLTLAAALPAIEQSTIAVISAAGRQGPGGAMAEEARRSSCEQTIPGASGSPTAVRQVLFEGTPAYVFVYPDLGLGRQVFVVAADCGRERTQAARVLYQMPR
jgi:hypothetical protein